MGFFVRIYMRVCKKMVIYLGIKTPQSRKERKYTCKKTHVYRIAGMIASIRGKKPHIYRVIILKQMADHSVIAMKTERTRIQFFSEVFSAVAVLGS